MYIDNILKMFRKTRFMISNCQFERSLDLCARLTGGQNWKLRLPRNSFWLDELVAILELQNKIPLEAHFSR